MPFYYNGTLGSEGNGSIPDPSVYGGRQLAVITPNTAHLPSSPSDLVKNNYVIVDRNLDDSVFPFTIDDSITFLSKYDSAIYNGSQWELQSGIQNTQSVQVVDKTNESISGNATTQQEANVEFTNEIKDLKTRSFRTIGYCGTTQPSQAREDDIFYQTNATSSYGSDLPTNFPIQVYRWNNGAWSANTENWTPDVNDVIINININPPIAFVWQNGWSPTTQGLSTTDDITIDRNNNGELQVKDSGITFPKLDPNAIATQNENSNNKVVRADAMYNTAITKNVSQIKTKTGGGKEIEIDLQNEDNVSKTKVNIDLDETATQNSNNPITSNGVWKEELNNTTSTLEYDDTNANKDVINLELKNNNGDTKIDKTIDFNDKIVFEDKTQELFNKTLDFDATSATKNIAENIPLSSLAKQTASDDKKILQVKGSDHHIDLSFLDIIKEVNSIPQTKDDEDVLLHLANDKHLYYWNEDESKYVAVGGGGVVKVNALPVSDIDSEVIYAVEETNTQVAPAETYIHYWIYDSNLSKWYEIYTDKYGDVVYENKEQTLTRKTIEAEDNNLNIFIDAPSMPVSDIKNTLYWDTTNKVLKYRKDNEWKICGEGDIKYVNTLPTSNISSKNLYCLTKTKWVYDETDYQTITKYCTDLTTTATGITLYNEAVETAWADLTPAMIANQGNHIWVKTDADNSWQFGYITNLLYDYYTQFEFVAYYEIYCNPTSNVNNYILIASNDNNLIKYYTKTETDKKFVDKQNFLNTLYPKGSIYTTYENKNPSTFLGGTWVLIGGQDSNLNYYPAFAIATDTEGTTIDESLPKITGSYSVGGNFPLTNIETHPASPSARPTVVSGAFSVEEEETTLAFSSSNITKVKPKALNFDASKGQVEADGTTYKSQENSTYKNGAQVNVNAIKIFFWRRTDDAPVVFNTGNITTDTSIDENATDDHIPTSKAVVDYVENSTIIDVASLPTTDIKDNVFYRTQIRKFLLDNKIAIISAFYKITNSNYALVDTYVVDNTDIDNPIYLFSLNDASEATAFIQANPSDFVVKYSLADDELLSSTDFVLSDGKYFLSIDVSEQITQQIQYYRNNEWYIVDNLHIDDNKLTPTTTRQDVGLVGEADIMRADEFLGAKANGIDIVLDAGTSSNPDIINDDPAYKYANNKTSSNNYINTRLETIERKADAKTITKFVDALPTNPDINTEYYVSAGTNNYNRYFVDSLGNVRNLGSTQIDISTLATKQEVNLKQDISNLTNTINANSTDDQYPSAKAVYDNCAPIDGVYAHANNSVSTFADDCVFDFHYKSSNNRASETKLFSNARIVHPISRSGWIYGSLMATQTLKTSAIVVFIQEFTESINGDTSGLLYFRRVGVLNDTGWNLVVSNKANIVWQDWQPVNYNYTKKGYSSAFNLDVCLWNVAVDGTDSIIGERRMLTNVSFTCPISNTNKFYRVETTIDNSGTTASGRASVITQIATRITNAGVTSLEVLKRVGLLSYDATKVPDVSKVYTYRNQIVWKNWFPVEYPQTNFTLDSTKATTNTCSYIISGSNLTIRITGLAYTTSSTNETIGSLPAGLYSVIKGRNPILAGYESNGIVRTMYIEVTNGDIKVNVSTGGTVLTNALQVYTSIPLGY